jgi:hypothetical protein
VSARPPFAPPREELDPWRDRGDLTVERLAGLARGIEPDGAVLGRVRAITLAAATTNDPSSPSRAVVGTSRPAWLPGRRVLVLALGATMLAASVGAAAAADAGGPLYEVRLGVEALLLPGRQAPPWAHAELDRLDVRLSEARRAWSRGDARGLRDAVAAYERTLREAFGTDVAPGLEAEELDRVLARHLELLDEIGQAAPEAAQQGLARARAEAERVRAAITRPAGQPGGRPARPSGPPDDGAIPGGAAPGRGAP